MTWLVYREQTDGCTIMDARNGREYRPPESPTVSVDLFCAETRTVYEFLGCLYHFHYCLPFRDVPTLAKDNLAERYEQTMARIQQITGAGYSVELVWECQFDRDILRHHPEMKQHPIFQHTFLNNRDALYGVEPRLWFFTTR